MNLFSQARLKLTILYVLIIMAVSIAFSAFVYQNIMSEVARTFRIRSLRTSFTTPIYLIKDAEAYEEIKRRVIVKLLFINGFILASSASLGYFLSGKTLSPIEKMLLSQKRFISDASHDLKTPISSIIAESEVALLGKLKLAESIKVIKSNLEEAKRMEELTKNLLSLSKATENGSGVLVSEFDLSIALKSLLGEFQKNAKKKNINLQGSFPKKAIIKGDKFQLTRAISEVINNAIKYTGQGGKVSVLAQRKGDHVNIEIKDTGIGIDKSDKELVFERFYRSDKARGRLTEGGHGLGLSIAREIIINHKGEIKVKSTSKKGTTFQILLPIS